MPSAKACFDGKSIQEAPVREWSGARGHGHGLVAMAVLWAWWYCGSCLQAGILCWSFGIRELKCWCAAKAVAEP